METLVKSNGLVRPCCMPENLVVSKKGDGEWHGQRADVVVRVCRTCKSRHIELTVLPGRAFAEGARL